MTRKPLILALSAILLATRLQAAQEPVSLLPEGAESLTPAGEAVECGLFAVVPVEGQKFKDAARVETVTTAPFPYNVRLQAATIGAIKKGDTLSAEFTARRTKSRQETGEALVAVIFERSEKPHEKTLERDLSVGSEWTTIRIPFRADREAAAGEMQLSLRVGYPPQTIEIGGVKLLNYGADVDPKDLPKTAFSYAGREPEAPWRKAAADRIEKIRKADLRIEVRDSAGNPVPGAKVAVRMKRHAFGFGTAIRSDWIVGESANHERYRETLKKYFNKAVFEDDIKWPNWVDASPEGKKRRADVMAALDWMDANHITPRGHVMVWPSWPRVPEFVKNLKDDPPKLRRVILDHIADQAAVLGDRIAEWDVINESYAHNDLMNILGREAMVEWFEAAHKGAPAVKLFYNDYVMFDGNGPGSPSQYYYDTIEFFLAKGAPIGGLGEQGHFGGSPPPPPRIIEVLDRFAKLRLPIQITEFDIDTSDVDTQTAYTRDFLTAVFSHPAVDSVLCWGFWEGRHWKPRAAFWSKDWQLRPNGAVWVELTSKQWWTEADIDTAPDGTAKVRGFLGDYEATATTPDGKTERKQFRLAAEGVKVSFGR